MVGDDNFTLTPCLLDNVEQWKAKVVGVGDKDSSEPWKVEMTCCVPEVKVPVEYSVNHDKLKTRGIEIHYSVNPALLRQYFTANNNNNEGSGGNGSSDSVPGPPYDLVLFVLPGLGFDGLPRYIDRKSDLAKLRLHMYFFAITKSSTIIARKDAAVMFLWVDQDSPSLVTKEFPFPLVDLHKLGKPDCALSAQNLPAGPFCKISRAAEEDVSAKCLFFFIQLFLISSALTSSGVITNSNGSQSSTIRNS